MHKPPALKKKGSAIVLVPIFMGPFMRRAPTYVRITALRYTGPLWVEASFRLQPLRLTMMPHCRMLASTMKARFLRLTNGLNRRAAGLHGGGAVLCCLQCRI